jgi:probable addiction module antidote protein
MEKQKVAAALKGAASHRDREIEELAADRELAAAYLTEALAAMDTADEFGRKAALLALGRIARSQKGGIAALARRANVNRESLYRTLSPRGNPTLGTLLSLLKVMGLGLAVVARPQADKAPQEPPSPKRQAA